VNTDTSYLGFRLPHPFMAGASPFGYYLDTVKHLEDAGWAAVVLHSLFVEQVTGLDGNGGAHLTPDTELRSALARFPPADEYPLGPDEYAHHISQIKQAVRIPVIGSLNGASTESWIAFARVIEQAGADAIELNPYEVVTNLDTIGADVERHLCALVTELKNVLTIPIAVKLSPFFAAFGNVARQLDQAGAAALVLFNRFYQPDIDVETMNVVPHVKLSTSDELLLRLRWIAILYGHLRAALAVTGGVAMPQDGIKAILAGADAVQVTSALLRNGPTCVSVLRRGLDEWMERHQMATLDEMRGLASLQKTANPAAFERANYIRVLHSWFR
jgi:dihydroorotate dehydrogenase (fumarate)